MDPMGFARVLGICLAVSFGVASCGRISRDAATRESAASSSKGLRAHPSILSLSEGQRGVFFCEGQNVELEWKKKDGSSLGKSTKVVGGRLVLYDLKQADSGEYMCSVKGTSSSPVTVQLNVIPENQRKEEETVEIQIVRRKVHQNQPADIRCDIAGDNTTNIVWSKMDEVLPSHAQQIDGVLKFPNVVTTDAGFYECRTKNAVNDPNKPQNLVQLVVLPELSPNVSGPFASTVAPGNATQPVREIRRLEEEMAALQEQLDAASKQLTALRGQSAILPKV